MFSTRIRALSILPVSSSCAITRRCCFASAVSFCCTMRSRVMESFSCTLSLFRNVLLGGMVRGRWKIEGGQDAVVEWRPLVIIVTFAMKKGLVSFHNDGTGFSNTIKRENKDNDNHDMNIPKAPRFALPMCTAPKRTRICGVVDVEKSAR
nr:hypothetical protein CFP56_78679 [Quercus suber]